MPAVVDAPLMTTAELLALPDDGMERWLIEGQLREKPMTVRNRTHSTIMANIVYLLKRWLETQPQPRGQVLCGEAGCRLRGNPETTVGIDVVYISPALANHRSEETTLIDGVPTLVVEILSPSDTIEEIEEKMEVYQRAGVSLIWVVNPYDRTISIRALNAESVLVNIRQELAAEPHLPGFRVAVAEIFA